jgi:uncharacterized membrane protein YcaP (DUF421 family)
MPETIFVSDWDGLARIALVGVPGYIALVFILKVAGKRTLSRMDSFDLVVTASLGSTLAITILSKSVVLAEGILAMALLSFMQLFISWLSVRSDTVSSLIKPEPRMLFFRGEFLEAAMRKERVEKKEVLQALRVQGIASLADVESVVLEADGSFSVVKRPEIRDGSTLSGLHGPS